LAQAVLPAFTLFYADYSPNASIGRGVNISPKWRRQDGVLTRVEYEKRRTVVMKEMEALVLPDGDNLLGHSIQVETFRQIWP